MSKETQQRQRGRKNVQMEELREVKTHQDSRKEHRLVLVGAGYAHLQVVRMLSVSEDQVGFSSITLIDVQKFANYRGMIPGFLSGGLKSYQDEASIDLEKICKQPGCTFVNDGVIDVDLKNKMVCLTDNSSQIPYDVLSFDIGSATKSLDEIPGAFEYTIPTRPTEELLSRLEGIEAELRQNPNLIKKNNLHELQIAIVGGDVNGVELALSLVARWRPVFKDKLNITLISEENSLANNDSTRIGHKCIREKLIDKGITIYSQEIVKEVERNLLKLESGLTIPFTYCIWATGAACHDLARTLQDQGLAVSTDGWIEVNNCLQSVSHPNVFAAGDCCQSSSLNVPKSGVFSIQEGPVLARNLKLFNSSRKMETAGRDLHPRNLEQFHPDIHGGFQFLECGDGTAMGFTSGMVIHGKWVQDIKMAMDREFVNWFDGQDQHQQRPGWDSSHISIDDDVFSEVLSMMSPAEGAALLGSISVVNYRQAWWLLKHMVHDVEYRQKVLKTYSQRVKAPNNDYFGFDIEVSNTNDGPSGNDQQQLPKTTPSAATTTPQTPLCT